MYIVPKEGISVRSGDARAQVPGTGTEQLEA